LQGDERMKPALIDTDIRSLFFRNDLAIIEHFREYLQEYGRMAISILTYYEILSGLKHRDALKQIDMFREFVKNNTIMPLTEKSVEISSDIYAALRKTGNQLDDIDIMIAGIAMAQNLVLVTHNINHFNRIEGLEVDDWSTF
jgi:tRNA(fMet)-specific endonuclease VapC